MQVVNEELKYQQAVLKHLGFYKGSVDGIWSEKTIAAKQQFEFKREFSPAIPNNGLPFGLSDRLPKGIYFKRIGNTMCLHHSDIDDSAMANLLGKTQGSVAVREPVVSNDGPVIEAPAETPAEVVEPTVAEEPKPQVQQNQQRSQQNPQHKHHPNHGQRR